MAKKASSTSKSKSSATPAGKRINWLDATAQVPMLNEYAQQMTSFVKAMEDGVIEEHEIKEQEARVVALMKDIEPLLNDELHDKVTKLLCEVTVYDLMQMLHSLQKERMATLFRG